MTGRILDGREIAGHVLRAVVERASTLHDRGVHPGLAFVSIGESASARMYLNRLVKLGAKHGVAVTGHDLPADVLRAELDREVASLNEDDAVDGIIVQMPLPAHLASAKLSITLDPRKDVDGITVHNAGRLYLGLPGHRPSTALAVMEILDFAGIDFRGQSAVIIGRSNVVGHPVAELLLARSATVTMTHRQTRNLPEVIHDAELLVVSAGRPGMVRGDMISPGVVIVDAGINVTAAGVVGDVVFEECLPIAGAITPVPRGVGPVTNAVLLRNVVDSAEQRSG